MGAIKAKKTKAKKTSSKSSLGSRLAGAAVSAFSGGSKKGGGGRRRNRGPAYWANKVLVEKLKKRYNRLKYGGAR
jgi:hypothetical protein